MQRLSQGMHQLFDAEFAAGVWLRHGCGYGGHHTSCSVRLSIIDYHMISAFYHISRYKIRKRYRVTRGPSQRENKGMGGHS
jgi:hypothetical protein